MNDSHAISKPTLLAVLAVALVVIGLVALVQGRLLVAGVAFLALSLAIYVREKNR